MKKYRRGTALILCILFLCAAGQVLGGAPENAQEFTDENGLVYRIADGEAALVDATRAEGELILPYSVNGYPLSTIGKGAFSRYIVSSVTSVTIPLTVVRIEAEGIRGNQLKEIVFRDPEDATEEERNLAEQVKAEPEIGDFAFNDTQLTSLTIPGRFKSIGDKVFDRSAIKNVILEPGIESIANMGLSQCDLESVTLPDTITKWGSQVLACTDIETLELPKGMEEIPDRLCEGCEHLKEVAWPPQLKVIGDCAFHSAAFTELELPDTIEKIGKGAFAYSQLQKFNWPTALKTIGESAFAGTHLQTVNVPDSVTEIGDSAFSRLDIATAQIPKSVGKFGSLVFGDVWQDTTLKSLTYGGKAEDWKKLLHPDLSVWSENPAYYSAVKVSCSDGIIEPDWSPEVDSSFVNIQWQISPKVGRYIKAQVICRQGTVQVTPDNPGLQLLSDDLTSPAGSQPVSLSAGEKVKMNFRVDDTKVVLDTDDSLPVLTVSYADKGGIPQTRTYGIYYERRDFSDLPIEVFLSNPTPKSGEPVTIMVRTREGTVAGDLFSASAVEKPGDRGVLITTNDGYGYEYNWPTVHVTASDISNGWPHEWTAELTAWGNPGDTIDIGFTGGIYSHLDGPPNDYSLLDSRVISLTIAEGTSDKTAPRPAPSSWYITAPSFITPQGELDAVLHASEEASPDKVSWTCDTALAEEADQKGLSAKFTAPMSGSYIIRAIIETATGPVYVSYIGAVMDYNDERLQLFGAEQAVIGEPVPLRVYPGRNILGRDISWSVSPNAYLETDPWDTEAVFRSFTPGVFTVTVTGKDAGGITQSDSRQITVVSPAHSDNTPPEETSPDKDPDSGQPAVRLEGPETVEIGKSVTYAVVVGSDAQNVNVQWSLYPMPEHFSQDARSITFTPQETGEMTITAFITIDGKETGLQAHIKVTANQESANPSAEAKPEPSSGGSIQNPGTVIGPNGAPILSDPAPSSVPSGASAADPMPTAPNPGNEPSAAETLRPSDQPGSAPPDSAPSSSGTSDEEDNKLRPVSDALLTIADEQGTAYLHGLSLASESVSASDLRTQIKVPDGLELHLTAPDGRELEPDEPVKTGTVITLVHPVNGVIDAATAVVKGDVLGTGEMNIAQLVRLAQAVKKEKPLDGPYLQAAKWTDGDRITIADLVCEARALQAMKSGDQIN